MGPGKGGSHCNALTGVSEGRGWTGVTEHGVTDGVTDGVTEHGDGGKHKFPVTQQAAG